MRTLILIIALTLTGCYSSHALHVGDDVTLAQAGDVHVSDDGYTLRLWFHLHTEHRESIQRLRWERLTAWESHRQSMCWPDFQTLRLSGPGEYHERRENTVWPGRSEGARWDTAPGFFKGVVLLEGGDGWLDADGEPVSNRLYFRWGGAQAGEVAELYGDGLTYTIEFWTSGHPDNPRPGLPCIRITVPDAIYVWVG
jgi:hypothetical protein